MKKLFFIAILFAGCIETDLQAPLDESLRIINSGDSFRVGETYDLQSEFLNEDGQVEDVNTLWLTSDPRVFSISGNMGTALSEGVVIITVRARGLEASQEIEIEASKGSLTISKFVDQLQVGNNFAMGVNYIDSNGNSGTPDISWTSSSEAIASIDSEGLVTALTVGTTTITATSEDLTDELILTVIEGTVMVDPEVKITQFVEELNVDEAFQFEANYFDQNGMVDETQSITWTSNNTEVLTVSTEGLATGISSGETTIEASSNGVSMEITVTVVGEEPIVRTGSLQGTGYSISGDFSLEYNEDEDLILTVNNYNSDGPGPYFYLTNQTTNIANGLNLGTASTNGTYTINVSEIARNESVEVELFTYSVLMVWCEPFGVRLGFGEFDN